MRRRANPKAANANPMRAIELGSGTRETALSDADHENVPPPAVCPVKANVATVSWNPVRCIIPLPEMTKNAAFCRSTEIEVRSKERVFGPTVVVQSGTTPPAGKGANEKLVIAPLAPAKPAKSKVGAGAVTVNPPTKLMAVAVAMFPVLGVQPPAIEIDPLIGSAKATFTDNPIPSSAAPTNLTIDLISFSKTAPCRDAPH